MIFYLIRFEYVCLSEDLFLNVCELLVAADVAHETKVRELTRELTWTLKCIEFIFCIY